MTLRTLAPTVLAGLSLASSQGAWSADTPAQPVDAGYTAKIREYTTEPFFLTELVDHLPASDRVPSPQKAAGLRDRHAGKTDVHQGHQRLLPRARRRVAARQGVDNRQERRGPGDAPGGHLQRGEPREARPVQRDHCQPRRSAAS